MKKTLLGIVAALTIGCVSIAEAVTFTWNPNTESDLAGYKLYMGTAPGAYTSSIDVGNKTTTVIAGLTPGTWYFALTAYDDKTPANESGFSIEISTTIAPPPDTTPPGVPQQFRITLNVDEFGNVTGITIEEIK